MSPTKNEMIDRLIKMANIGPIHKGRLKRTAIALNIAGGRDEFQADPHGCVVDLLANLMHYCRQTDLNFERDLEFETCLETARSHYQAEQEPT